VAIVFGYHGGVKEGFDATDRSSDIPAGWVAKMLVFIIEKDGSETPLWEMTKGFNSSLTRVEFPFANSEYQKELASQNLIDPGAGFDPFKETNCQVYTLYPNSMRLVQPVRVYFVEKRPGLMPFNMSYWFKVGPQGRWVVMRPLNDSIRAQASWRFIAHGKFMSLDEIRRLYAPNKFTAERMKRLIKNPPKAIVQRMVSVIKPPEYEKPSCLGERVIRKKGE
jgi:hypothetical protein